MAEFRVDGAILDPRWEAGILEIDAGVRVPCLKLVHPRHGEIVAIIPQAGMHKMIEAMSAALSTLETKQ